MEEKAGKRSVQQRMQDAGNEATSSMKWLQMHFPQISAVAGGVIVVYGVSRFMVSMTNQFMATTLTDAAWMGFYGGFAAAGLSAGALFVISRALTIRPERVFRHALRRVQAHEAAQHSLGLHIHSGELRAYTIRQGYMYVCILLQNRTVNVAAPSCVQVAVRCDLSPHVGGAPSADDVPSERRL